MNSDASEQSNVMTLQGQGSSLRLAIVRYQFPDMMRDDWDSNWLVIEGRVNLNGREWNFRDPCLTTFEVARLAEWLDSSLRGSLSKDYCGFTEPNLQFDRRPNDSIRVSFALESAPPWAERGDEESEHSFDIPIGPDLGIAAEQLRRQLACFPIRGSEPR